MKLAKANIEKGLRE